MASSKSQDVVLKSNSRATAALPATGEIGTVKLLLGALEDGYEPLLRSLTVRLQSMDAAKEALHDVYVKLSCAGPLGIVQRPSAYLLKMAVNLAKNKEIREAWYRQLGEVEENSIADDAPNPEQIVGAHGEIAVALKALDMLTSQRRAIFLARWRDGMPHIQIANEFGLHKRTVQKELSRAEQAIRDAFQLPAR
ncbi:MAG TPA: sigma-70 family RNA polymerase sigma factor [Sphingobium sp.]|uniref:RNA polymerase sigma factor n=1 Tax=Sphingobium sp. TaxID=1912891 RepID=UPI002ED66A50